MPKKEGIQVNLAAARQARLLFRLGGVLFDAVKSSSATGLLSPACLLTHASHGTVAIPPV
ncbi:MAG TPA: hypothetical protein VFU31_30940 [Candidatus Binatia bacterium]|nr:hypothetical protein [Candidatus Binatia bacterium]